jgi:hypothetical protein
VRSFSSDGSLDEEYSWGRHPTSYSSPRFMVFRQALRGLLQDARVVVPSRLYAIDVHQDLKPDPKRRRTSP